MNGAAMEIRASSKSVYKIVIVKSRQQDSGAAGFRKSLCKRR